MNITEQNTLEIRELLKEFIGNVTAKTLFTGYGLFYEGLMFAIYKNGILYLKAEGEQFTQYLESQGAVSWVQDNKNSMLSIASYYRLPAAITKDKHHYKKVVTSSIHYIKSKKIADELNKKERIKELANLTIKHERLLAKVDIHNVSSFRKVGPANAYVRLKKFGLSVNINLYFNLAAALLNKHVSLLTEKEKSYLLSSLNTALTNAGLKPPRIRNNQTK